MRRMRKLLGLLLPVAAVTFAAPLATAQQYPFKPVRIIVPLAAGGPSDLLARTVGQKLTEAWGQPVLVDIRPGVNGILGSDLVAKSPPDGYTLLLATSGTHGINASLVPKLSYDTVKDYAPIARIGYAPYVLVAHPSLPVRSIKALIQLGKARPGEVTWAYGGSASQLAAALFKSMAQVDLLLVPYKGNALAVTAVIGGETSLVFGGIAQAVPQVKAGRLRALGVTSTGRSPIMPAAPPIAETVPGFEVSTWYGLLAPAGTPRSIIERINTELMRILQLPDVRRRLAAEAFELPADTPDQFAAIIKAELAKWPKVVKETGARTD
jgi:tripartite-type tricarboxylate transporter receptor subunit TctC